ncbi:MAG: hypothetical protein WCG83_06415 [Candidatus Peregrinibacteria bacterium]
MKQFSILSFCIGMLSGFLVLWIVVGGYRWMFTASTSTTTASATTGAGRRAGGGGSPANLATIAKQLNMTEADLQKELATGKTIKQIATEKGVQLTFGNRGGSGAVRTGSGTTTSGSLRFRNGSQRTSGSAVTP